MQPGDLTLQLREQREPDGSIRTFLDLHNASIDVIDDAWRLYFSLGLKPVDESGLKRIMIDGRYGYLAPVEGWQLAPGATHSIGIESWLFSGMKLLARQGFHLVRMIDGEEHSLGEPAQHKPVLVDLDAPRLPVMTSLSPHTVLHPRDETPDPSAAPQLTIPSSKEFALSPDRVTVHSLRIENHPDTSNEAGALRDALAEMSLYDESADTAVALEIDINIPGDYTVQTEPGQCHITGRTAEGVFQGIQSFLQLLTCEPSGWQLPVIAMTDQADFSHRGLFVDIARHFQPAAQLRKVIDAMARYKLNRLQLGICNDEGWRLEIISLPSLTEVGARRSYRQFSDDGSRRALAPAWGDGHQDVEGYLTANEFIELLKYARRRHVEIVPEINVPAHANALIHSLADSNFLLLDPDDTSDHQSAQGYRHNVLNVGMPDTYRVIRLILEDILKMYQFAGVPLQRIHLGGDEIPAGAWLHSPACHRLPVWDQSWNVDQPDDAESATAALLRYHCEQLTKVVSDVAGDVQLGFWHEMSAFGGKEAAYNIWTTEAGDPAPLAAIMDRQQSFIISNASYLYLDMPYGLDPDEPGLPWAAYTDTRSIFEFDPIAAWNIPPESLGQVQGLQAQLWSETVTDESLMDYYLFPRLLAVAERAWNRTPVSGTWQWFLSALEQRELPWLASKGVSYRPLKRLPGPAA